ncbi:hypothetical protein BDN71DRAFT_1455277 [Pleurotus eryngii]|uniref:F-box domain-containing protein n=1 Tax=Pleurotus eryngii TaxID=5323 RepID=A0A9P5ZKZ8_PLEER|nr:hypothetical protein BDN71DRAFT_1455277 [Pleurotus eryngii]
MREGPSRLESGAAPCNEHCGIHSLRISVSCAVRTSLRQPGVVIARLSSEDLRKPEVDGMDEARMSAVSAFSPGLYSDAGSNLLDERDIANESQIVWSSIVCNMWHVAIISSELLFVVQTQIKDSISTILPHFPLYPRTPMSTVTHSPRQRGISKLHEELLLEIFTLVSTTQYSVEGRCVPPSHSLLTISHVCRSWRTAVRGAPKLWSFISGVESPLLMREVIVMSQQIPLVLSNYFDNDEGGADDEDDAKELHAIEELDSHGMEARGHHGDEGINTEHDVEEENDEGDAKTYPLRRGAASMLFAELHRMAAIRILVHYEDALTLPTLLAAAAPLLESLDLKVEDLDKPLVLIPFGGVSPPRLTRLALEGGLEIPWDAPVYAHLTHLHLKPSSNTDKYQYKCGYRLFAHALAQMSSLESLELVGCIPDDIFWIEAEDDIRLPRLTDLLISDYAPNCDMFLRSIECKLHTLRVAGSEDEDHEDWTDYANVYLALFNACKQHMAPQLTAHPVASFIVETGLNIISFRGLSRCRNSSEDTDTLFDVTIFHKRSDGSSPVNEEFVARALNMVPPREGRPLQLELPDDRMFDAALIAAQLDKLDEGIRHISVELVGYKGQCWCMRGHRSDLVGDENPPSAEVDDVPMLYDGSLLS